MAAKAVLEKAQIEGTDVPDQEWERDDFDSLQVGPLSGQSGWTGTGQGVRVIARDDLGAPAKMLRIDAPEGTGSTGFRDKLVPQHGAGRHVFELDVMVDGTTEPSVGAIAVSTSGNRKKFWLYAGSSIRVRHGDASVAVVPVTQWGRFYRIRCEIDLDSNVLDVLVDGVVVARGLAMPLGPITGLSVTGWEQEGAVYMDAIVGSVDVSGSPWERDEFDGLVLGPLNGQNGWTGTPSADVVPRSVGGQALRIDPRSGSGDIIKMSKNVARQIGGRHRFSLYVYAVQVSDFLAAKIELKRDVPPPDYNKLFQLYFGTSIRVNYGPNEALDNATVLRLVAPAWYRVVCDMNLDTATVTITASGAGTSGSVTVPMQPGELVGLGLSGWDRAGVVYLDSIVGQRL